jgi:hypothetical protein
MRVKVTQEYIDKGIRADSYYCPLALCLKDMGYQDATVVPYVNYVLISWRVPAPTNATSLTISDPVLAHNLNRYDEMGVLEPFEIVMEMSPSGRYV